MMIPSSFCSRVSSCCDTASQYLQVGGIASSGLSALLAAFYFNSPPLAALSLIPIASGAIAYRYIHEYRRLKPINEVATELGSEADQIGQTAARVSGIALRELELGGTLKEEEKETGIELQKIAASEEVRLKTTAELTGLAQSVTGNSDALKAENQKLQLEVEKLKKELKTFSTEIEKWKKQNQDYLESAKKMGGMLDHLEREEKELNQLDRDLSTQFSEWMATLQTSRENFQKIGDENSQLKAQIIQLNLSISRLEKTLESKHSEMKEIKTQLEKLREEVSRETQELRSIKIEPNQLRILSSIADRFNSATTQSAAQVAEEEERKRRIAAFLGGT